jgi:DNA invertase Pin-like site-specific DNA recombinase
MLMLATIAQLERDWLVERTLLGFARRKAAQKESKR